MKYLKDKVSDLSSPQLFRLVDELKEAVLPEDALVREVIRDTEVDDVLFHVAMLAVYPHIAETLTSRLKYHLAWGDVSKKQ